MDTAAAAVVTVAVAVAAVVAKSIRDSRPGTSVSGLLCYAHINKTTNEVSTMAIEKKIKREGKKAPLLSMKEKRAAKAAKRAK